MERDEQWTRSSVSGVSYYPAGSRSPSLKGNQGPKQLEGLEGKTRGRSRGAGGDSEKRAEDPRPLVEGVHINQSSVSGMKEVSDGSINDHTRYARLIFDKSACMRFCFVLFCYVLGRLVP